MDAKYVSVQDCEVIWEKRYINNGFKYMENIIDVELIRLNKDLWV
jgi:hypothetical protein